MIKKDKNKEIRLNLEKTPDYIAVRKDRDKIERKIGVKKRFR